MYKFVILIIFLIIPLNSFGHVSHYKNIKEIEMEVFKDGKSIGYSKYKFIKRNNLIEVHNMTNFELKVFGVKIFVIKSNGIEIYKDDKLISFKSETLQNDKKKYVNLIYDEEKKKYNIKGSSYTGEANQECIIGNWWNHRILQSKKQISPLSGSIKKQDVTFIKKEKIIIYGKQYFAHKFKLKSQNPNIEKDKKLDFDIWLEPKKNLILKVSYERLGKWEYILKNIIKN